jgi:hypothetical protein
VRLSVLFWLLVSAVLGGGTGLVIAHRPGTGGAVDASAPVVVARAKQATATAPQLIYWNVRRHLALDLQQPGLHPLGRAAVGSHTLDVNERAAAGPQTAPTGEVVTFSSGPRRFAVESGPGDGGSGTSTGSDTASGTTTTTPAPPVNTTPIVISDVHTVSLSPFSAAIAWHTSEAVSSRISYGLSGPTLWTPASAGTDHTATVNGLAWSTTYDLWVNANATDGRSATQPYALTTPPFDDASPTISTGNGQVLVDGQLIFPSVVMGACPESFPQLLADGVNFFEDSRCDDPSVELSDLAGKGFLIDPAWKAHIAGAVASFLPDEWDTFLPGTLTADQAAKMVPYRGPGPRFLTLTNHFYSAAAPLPQGRGMYPALAANADILSFDLYPLQNWCRYDGNFHDVFDSQRELVALGGGTKPTFQWIEARHMDCKDPILDPTPQTVRAEVWLSIAGGAHGIGYFPYDWSSDIGAEIAREKTEIETLAPALVDQSIQASANDGTLRVGARQHNGAIYVIAVNATRNNVTSTINVPGLANRALTSLDGTRTVTAANGSFTDSFGPLEVHIYISSPPTS